MYYAIFYLIVLMIFAPAFEYSLPYVNVIISFMDGKYNPHIVRDAGGQIIEEFKDVGMLHAVVPPYSVANISQDPAVEFVEPDGQFEIAGTNTTENSGSWALGEIGIEPDDLSNHTGRGVKIAVLDTGIDYTNTELVPSYKGGYDFINSDNDPMDDNGHGTHVAGILAAARDGKGIVGVAPDAEIYAIKVSDKNGKGSFSGLVEGINWAIENHMDIVTMSITGEGSS